MAAGLMQQSHMVPKPLLALAGAAALAAGCATEVTHPTKSTAEMQADIDLCTGEAERKYWMDPIAALYNSYDCLEAKGYQRDRKDFASKVERALGEAPARRAAASEPGKPCKVPCRP